MPNWCENKMTIKHQDPLMVKRARDAWMSGQFLSEFIPIPNDLKIVSGRVGADNNPEQVLLVSQQVINKAQHGYVDWYAFSTNEWGTKWDIGYCKDEDNAPYNENQAEFTVRYNSAWSPPEAACFKLVAMGFDITNYYYEPGMGFCGVFKDGADTTYSTGQAPEEIQEQFGFDSPIIELTKDQLISALMEDDVSDWDDINNFKVYVKDLVFNGVHGYKDMSEDDLKDEYINRELHLKE